MIKWKDIKRVLVLAPHTDDGEIGCGGTIAKLTLNGVDVHYVAFSSCEQSVLAHFPSDILKSEVKEATNVLGVKPKNLHVLNYSVRTFKKNRQPILDDIIRFRERIHPDLVLMPSLNDIHQDHSTIAEEGLRAFKFCNILCYEMPWNNLNFDSTCFIELEQSMLNKKIEAVEKYKSQTHRPYANADLITSLAKVRGVQIGVKFAEVFEVLRLIS